MCMPVVPVAEVSAGLRAAGRSLRRAVSASPRPPLQELAQLAAGSRSGARLSALRRSALDDERHRIDAEAGDAELQPVPHDPLDLGPHRAGSRCSGRAGSRRSGGSSTPAPPCRTSRSTPGRPGRPCRSSSSSGASSTRRTSRGKLDPGPRRASWNQGCSSEVWLTTRSMITLMPAPVRLVDELDELARASRDAVSTP